MDNKVKLQIVMDNSTYNDGSAWALPDGEWEKNYANRGRAILITGIEIPEWIPGMGDEVIADDGSRTTVKGTPYVDYTGRWCIELDYQHKIAFLSDIRPVPETITGVPIGKIEVVEDDVATVTLGIPPGTYDIITRKDDDE